MKLGPIVTHGTDRDKSCRQADRFVFVESRGIGPTAHRPSPPCFAVVGRHPLIDVQGMRDFVPHDVFHERPAVSFRKRF